MNAKTKIIASTLLFFTAVGCCQKLTISQINKPAKEYFKKQLEKQVQEYPEYKKETVENETFYFNNRLNARKAILDSLDILKNSKIIIIDKVGDNNGKRYEISYIFYGDEILKVDYPNTSDKKDNHTVYKMSKSELENNSTKDVLEVYNYFNKNNFKEVKGDISFNNFIFFNVTLVLNNEVGYYEITSNSDGFKVEKLR